MKPNNKTYPNGTPLSEPRYCIGQCDLTHLYFVYDRKLDDRADVHEFETRDQCAEHLLEVSIEATDELDDLRDRALNRAGLKFGV